MSNLHPLTPMFNVIPGSVDREIEHARRNIRRIELGIHIAEYVRDVLPEEAPLCIGDSCVVVYLRTKKDLVKLQDKFPNAEWRFEEAKASHMSPSYITVHGDINIIILLEKGAQ